MSQNVIAFDPAIPASQIRRIAATLIAGIKAYQALSLPPKIDPFRPASSATITARQRIEIDHVARGIGFATSDPLPKAFEILEPLSPDEMDAIAEQFLKVDPDPPNDPDPES